MKSIMNVNATRKAVDVLANLHIRPRKPVKSLSKLRRRDRELTRRWGWDGHIRGLGFGYKRVNGEPDLNTPCVTVYVRRKSKEQRIPERERIPQRLHLESVGSEVIMDIIEICYPIVAQAAPNIQPADDVAHEYGDNGTLGLLVRAGADPGVLAASCSHVLARSGVSAAQGDWVEHPLGSEENEFGTLTDTFTRLNQTDVFDEDFALARIDVPYSVRLATDGTIIDNIADSTSGFSPQTPTVLHGVKNQGVLGQILNPSWSGVVDDVPFVGSVQYENLVPYSTPNAGGDSGAVILQAGTTTALGLHVAGSAMDSLGFFMPLWPIFGKYTLQLVKSE